MTDPAPAYATAVEQLRARAEAAEKERDDLRAQLNAARTLTPHDSLGADKWLPELNRAERERTDAQNRADAAERACDDLRDELAKREMDAARLDVVTKERDDLRAQLKELKNDTDLCRLASAAFPGLTFTPVDLGRGLVVARSPSVRVRCRPEVAGFMVTVPGDKADYTGTGNTIEAAHADALAFRAEYESEAAPAPTVQGALDL